MNEEAKDINMKEETPEKDMETTPENAGEETAPQDTEDENAVLQARLEAAEHKRDEYLDIAQRIQAEFENYKKRNRSAVSDACQVTADETIAAFLPILDNLERARKAAEDCEDVEDIVTGVEMVIKQFTDLLTQMDVKAIDAVGKTFDPEYHHAMMNVEASNPEEADTVVEELVKGYMRGDKVIRCSMVKVAN